MRALLPALAVGGLVVVVAIAASGSTPAGSGDTRPPSETLLDTIFSLTLLLVIPAAAIVVYGLLQRRAIQREMASGRYRRSGLAGFLAFVAVLLAISYFKIRDWERPLVGDAPLDPVFGGGPLPVQPPADAEPAYRPELAELPVLVVLGLAAAGGLAAYLVLRRRAPDREADDVAHAVADVLDDTLDDLRGEADPRRAVIAAFARLERVLAAHGLPRKPAETAQELVARALGGLDVDGASVRRLAELFAEAKFSDHDVDAAMKEEAIAALESVRDQLRASRESGSRETARGLRAGEGPA